ncbi:ParB N-terminal domain-containing protein [Bacillus sp. UNC437CL72CviS29]|uniref:ParB N-terminal domain-containing protein n=1 Tax=Bacillus sp. UNC437CL72CviS29 TaxID=1340430 RepID=UPI00047D29ED|nr:ParB N-terminal domain-containing protein [Bacillus sp. UNC437CL72CviS29]
MVNLMRESEYVHSFLCNNHKIELAVVDIDKLIPHEEVDLKKIKTVSEGIKDSGFVKHTIPCIKYDDKFIVLDGHHRLASLKGLGYKRAPIQIVSQDSIVLDYWYHVIGDSNWKPQLSDTIHLNVGVTIAEYKCKDSESIMRVKNQNINDIFTSIQDIYHSYGVNRFYRQSTMPQNESWVQYSGISLETIINNALKGNLMPPGLSRFKIPYKVLNLEVPLSLLENGEEAEWICFYEKTCGFQVCDFPVVCIN